MQDLDTTLTVHPSEVPAFVAAHRVAFHDLPVPDKLHVGELVWIIDHYYPGVVNHVDAHGHAVVKIPQWDYDVQAPMTRKGKLITSELHYHKRHYPQLRVDVASAAFWPEVPCSNPDCPTHIDGDACHVDGACPR